MEDFENMLYDLEDKLRGKLNEVDIVGKEISILKKKHKRVKPRKHNGWYFNLRFLWWYIMSWHNREEQPYELMEQLHIVTFSARRCAYDLAHATSFIRREESGKWADVFQNSAAHYQTIFTPWGGKDYRLELHERIYDLDKKVGVLEELCDENNIKVPYERMPF
jgi:hypothetical protein